MSDLVQKDFALIAGMIFLLISVLHSLRIMYSWPAMIGDMEVPMWASWVAIGVALYLAYIGIKIGKKG